ncbi:MAG: tRNA uridine-5-carboxymethylaminomethyl(34) synthesis GTPase MnmE [Acidobacteriota bacterium]
MTALDTIVAPATAPGRSALAIVRIDGPRAGEILAELMRAALPPPRRATVARLFRVAGRRSALDGSPDQRDVELLDECVVLRYVAPHSFTGNDLVELTLHGNPLLVRQLIEGCVSLGVRLAEPGEFTERAVLNGKMDLVQAESIADLINARTALQAKLSLSNVEGALSRKAGFVRQTLLEVISRLEAALDFAEEGYEFITRNDVRERLEAALRETLAIGETYRRGVATRAGLNAVILGRPNAGKSSLLNRLVGSDRAIVTAIPGTTRDILRETVEIGGLPVTFADTAGLRDSSDLVEKIGIRRARDAARSADIVLYLVDGTVGLTADDTRELDGLESVLMVYTKADLLPAGADPDRLSISAVLDIRIDELLGRLDELVRDRFVASEGSLFNERQRAAIDECGSALTAALEAADLDEQMILVDLYRAANALGTLTGAITRDEILAEIFGKFCIGK